MRIAFWRTARRRTTPRITRFARRRWPGLLESRESGRKAQCAPNHHVTNIARAATSVPTAATGKKRPGTRGAKGAPTFASSIGAGGTRVQPEASLDGRTSQRANTIGLSSPKGRAMRSTAPLPNWTGNDTENVRSAGFALRRKTPLRPHASQPPPSHAAHGTRSGASTRIVESSVAQARGTAIRMRTRGPSHASSASRSRTRATSVTGDSPRSGRRSFEDVRLRSRPCAYTKSSTHACARGYLWEAEPIRADRS